MSMPLIDFESSRAREQQRLQAQQARKAMLEKVRAQHDHKRRQLEDAKMRGEDSWMLPSVEKSLHKQGEKQHKKKSKKEKKNKKKKKKKSKKESSSSSDSSSEAEWVERTDVASTTPSVASEENPISAPQSSARPSEDQAPSRDDWMEMPSLFGTFTRDELRQREGGSRVLAKQLEKKKARDPDKPGSHALELNPYFKDGGSGLPQCAPGADEKRTGAAAPLVGFGASAAWLKKSLQRAKEEAAEEGVTLEEVAEKRWGSLDKFHELLLEAEKRDNAVQALCKSDAASAADKNSNVSRDSRQRDRHRLDGRSDSRSQNARRDGRKFLAPRSRSSSSGRSQSRSPPRSKHHHRHEKRSRNKSSSSSRSRSRSPASRRRKPYREDKTSGKKERSYSESDEDKKSYRRGVIGASESKDKRRSRNDRSHSNSSASSDDKKSRRKDVKESRSQDSRRFKKGRSYSDSSCSENEATLHKRNRPGGSPSGHDSSRAFRDESSQPVRRLLKPGESQELTKSHRDQRQERAVWENTRRLPSSAAPATGGWRKKVQPEALAPKGDAIQCGDVADVKDEEQLSIKDSKQSPQHTTAPPHNRAGSVPDKIAKDAPVESKPKKVYTTHELNQIGAKIVKAELVGNHALAEKLKRKLENARKETQEALVAGDHKSGQNGDKMEETVLLTTTDSRGFTRPVRLQENDSSSSSSKRMKRSKPSAVGADGNRDKYFPDDHKFSLKQMFEQEKQGGTEDSDAMFVRAAARSQKASLDDDYTLDDSFVDKSALREDRAGQDARDRMRAIMDHQRREQALAACTLCCDSSHMKKHLIISLGSKSYLSLPAHESLVDGHCLIVPRDHIATSTLLDEDIWLEMMNYRKSLVRFFNSRDEDVVFLECCMHLRRQPHTVVHCLPLPREQGDLAPIYFKKAIQESESEWNQNVKLVELKGKDVRRAIPRGFPYFAVDFGTSPGYAHVIEDEATFPKHFGQSVVGGMLDLETQLWRKPKPETFDQQRRKVLAFAKEYEQFDPMQET